MASSDRQLLFFNPSPFLRPLPFDLLQGRRVGVVDATARIGADLHDLPTLAAVHNDGFLHLCAWPLQLRLLCRTSVRLGLLDFEFHVAISSQRSAFASVPRGGNLDESRFRF